MKFVLAAEEGAGVRALQALLASPHELVGVLSTPSDQRPSPVWQIAEQRRLQRWPAERVKSPDLARELRALDVDVILNVHSLYMFHPAVLESARVGAFNLHPGPLPKYAGLNCPSWAIYRGEDRYGVSLHHMVGRVDAGPIAYQATFDVAHDETGLSLSMKCVKSGMELIERLLDELARPAPRVPAVPQDIRARQYFGRERPVRGPVDLATSVEILERLIRACEYGPYPSPWGHPLVRTAGVEFAILKAVRAARDDNAPPGSMDFTNGVELACAGGWLRLQTIAVEGQRLPADSLKRYVAAAAA